MRRLRAILPFAACRARVGGEAPAERAPTLGRIGRRRFLGALVAAPVALPAVAKEALAPEPFSSTIFFDVDGTYAASLTRYHDELDAWADEVQIWRDGPVPPPPAYRGPSGLDAPRDYRRQALPVARPLPFVDDVGSGP